jgi:hypothetical protein
MIKTKQKTIIQNKTKYSHNADFYKIGMPYHQGIYSQHSRIAGISTVQGSTAPSIAFLAEGIRAIKIACFLKQD